MRHRWEASELASPLTEDVKVPVEGRAEARTAKGTIAYISCIVDDSDETYLSEITESGVERIHAPMMLLYVYIQQSVAS